MRMIARMKCRYSGGIVRTFLIRYAAAASDTVHAVRVRARFIDVRDGAGVSRVRVSERVYRETASLCNITFQSQK